MERLGILKLQGPTGLIPHPSNATGLILPRKERRARKSHRPRNGLRRPGPRQLSVSRADEAMGAPFGRFGPKA